MRDRPRAEGHENHSYQRAGEDHKRPQRHPAAATVVSGHAGPASTMHALGILVAPLRAADSATVFHGPPRR
jgi:hypothetical protein